MLSRTPADTDVSLGPGGTVEEILARDGRGVPDGRPVRRSCHEVDLVGSLEACRRLGRLGSPLRLLPYAVIVALWRAHQCRGRADLRTAPPYLGAPQCVVSARLLVAAGLATHAGRACEHRRNVLKQLEEVLTVHELVKVKLQEGCPLSVSECAEELSIATSSAVTQTLGRTILLYRPHPDKPVIVMPQGQSSAEEGREVE